VRCRKVEEIGSSLAPSTTSPLGHVFHPTQNSAIATIRFELRILQLSLPTLYHSGCRRRSGRILEDCRKLVGSQQAGPRIGLDFGSCGREKHCAARSARSMSSVRPHFILHQQMNHDLSRAVTRTPQSGREATKMATNPQ
jgi:hypothetical protein